jgi:hypothetical protein
MRMRAVVVLFVAVLLLLGSCCKRRSAADAALPKGYGTLEVFVRDEGGKPVTGARVRIENRNGEAVTVATDTEGKTRGAGSVSEGPFRLNITADGFVAKERGPVTLVEGQTTSLMQRLKRK